MPNPLPRRKNIASSNRLILTDGGSISANSLGIGSAGNIHIQANQLSLTNSGEITSAAAQAVGGSVTVFAAELLFKTKSLDDSFNS